MNSKKIDSIFPVESSPSAFGPLVAVNLILSPAMRQVPVLDSPLSLVIFRLLFDFNSIVTSFSPSYQVPTTCCSGDFSRVKKYAPTPIPASAITTTETIINTFSFYILLFMINKTYFLVLNFSRLWK